MPIKKGQSGSYIVGLKGSIVHSHLGPVNKSLADLAHLEHGGGLDVVPGGKGKLKNPDQQITFPSQRLEYQ